MRLGKRVESRKANKRSKKAKFTKISTTAKSKKQTDKRKPSPINPEVLTSQFDNAPSQVRERYVITVEDIRGDTFIGDLLVTFPRTREVLVRKGLRLEAEDAGDIYMTLDAFSAMNGLEIQGLVREIAEAAKEAPTQQSTPQILASAIPTV